MASDTERREGFWIMVPMPVQDRLTTWLARRFLGVAGRIDPTLRHPPTVEREARAQLVRTRFELLHAEEQQERWHHTCEMLRARVERLKRYDTPAAAAESALADWPENAGQGAPLTSKPQR